MRIVNPPSAKQLHYRFDHITNCEMCGNDLSDAQILGQRLNGTQGREPRSRTGITVSVIKCRACGLVSPQPLPVPDDFQQHYGILPEEFWNEGYYNWTPQYFSGEITVARKLLGNRTGLRALDIGAGIGKCMRSLELAGFDAYGFEPSQQFFEKAFSVMKISPEKLKFGMVEDMDYPEGSFDFITFGAVFEHLYHPASILEKVMHWLKPGGVIHIEVPSAWYFISTVFNFYYRLRGTNYVTNLSPMHVPFHLYEFTLKSFQEAGKRSGFEIVHHEFAVGDIMHLPGFLKPLLRKYMEATKKGMQLTVYLKKK